MVWVECVGGLLDVPHRHAGHQAGVEPAAEQDGQRRIAHEPLDHRVDEGLLRQRGEGEGEGKGGAGGGRLLTWERGGGNRQHSAAANTLYCTALQKQLCPPYPTRTCLLDPTLRSGRSTGVLGTWSKLIQSGLNQRSTLPVVLR